MRVLVRLLTLITLAALCACTHAPRKPDLPCGAVKPEVVIVERKVYVPIPAHLTAAQPIAEGPLSACPDVARARRAALEVCNSRARQIQTIQGTPVATDGK